MSLKIPETRFVKNDVIPPNRPGLAEGWPWIAVVVGIVVGGGGDASGVGVSLAGGVGVVAAGVVPVSGGGGEIVAVVGTVVGKGGDGVTVGVVGADCSKVMESVSSSHDGGLSESQAITVNGGEILTVSDGGSIGAVPEITPLSERWNPSSYCCPGSWDPGLTAQWYGGMPFVASSWNEPAFPGIHAGRTVPSPGPADGLFTA